MYGSLQEAWPFAWPDIWLKLEQSEIWMHLSETTGYTVDELYTDLYVELAKALKKAPQPKEYDSIAYDPLLARRALETTSSVALRCESAIARFFENAFDAISESGSTLLENEYRNLVRNFCLSRNLRYEVADPFKLHSNLPGVFAALYSDLVEATKKSPQLQLALLDLEHAFRSLGTTHAEADMKTFIAKTSMLAEALASAVPGSRGTTLGEICGSLQCWPHPTIKEAVKKIYGFCSDYPGIRHNTVSSAGSIKPLEVRDSIIVPILLLTFSGYFGPNQNLLDTLRNHASEPKQEPPDPPELENPALSGALP